MSGEFTNWYVSQFAPYEYFTDIGSLAFHNNPNGHIIAQGMIDKRRKEQEAQHERFAQSLVEAQAIIDRVRKECAKKEVKSNEDAKKEQLNELAEVSECHEEGVHSEHVHQEKQETIDEHRAQSLATTWEIIKNNNCEEQIELFIQSILKAQGIVEQVSKEPEPKEEYIDPEEKRCLDAIHTWCEYAESPQCKQNDREFDEYVAIIKQKRLEKEAQIDKFLEARMKERKKELKGVYNHLNRMVQNMNNDYSFDLKRSEFKMLNKLDDILNARAHNTE